MNSGDLEWIGSTLLENRRGRTKLQSIRDAEDDPAFDFFFIETFNIDAKQPSEIATQALRKFLRSEQIMGKLNYGCWRCSSFAYVLPAVDDSSTSPGKRKQDEDNNSREAIPFIRNGFFQDLAIVNGNDPANARILVAGVSNVENGLLSETEGKRKISLLKTGKVQKKIKNLDLEILNLVQRVVIEIHEQNQILAMRGLSSRMIGIPVPLPRETDSTSDQQVASLR